MAQGVLQSMVEQQNLGEVIDRIDSAGTGAYHVGSDPDSRTLSTLNAHQMSLSHSARQLCEADFAEFDFILAMDRQNLEDILSIAPSNHRAKIQLYGEYSVTGQSHGTTSNSKLNRVIKDPYYGSNNSGFETAYKQSENFGQGLIKHLQDLSGR